jgi:hypothetical protein
MQVGVFIAKRVAESIDPLQISDQHQLLGDPSTWTREKLFIERQKH